MKARLLTVLIAFSVSAFAYAGGGGGGEQGTNKGCEISGNPLRIIIEMETANADGEKGGGGGGESGSQGMGS